MINYGKNLKDTRLLNNKTLLQIQKDTGISNQNLSNWENNKTIPNIDFCVKLANYYGISLDELIGRDYAEQDNIKYNQTYIAKNINVNNK